MNSNTKNKFINDVNLALDICQTGADAARYIMGYGKDKRISQANMCEVNYLMQNRDIAPDKHINIKESAIYENVIEIGINNAIANCIVSDQVNTDGNYARIDPFRYGDLTIAESTEILIDMRKQVKRQLASIKNKLKLSEREKVRTTKPLFGEDVEYKSKERLHEVVDKLEKHNNELKCMINYMYIAVVAREDYHNFVIPNEELMSSNGRCEKTRNEYFITTPSMLRDIRFGVRINQKNIRNISSKFSSYGCDVIYEDMDSIIIVPSDDERTKAYIKELREARNVLNMPKFDIMDAKNAVLSRNGFIRTWDAKVRNKTELIPTPKSTK